MAGGGGGHKLAREPQQSPDQGGCHHIELKLNGQRPAVDQQTALQDLGSVDHGFQWILESNNRGEIVRMVLHVLHISGKTQGPEEIGAKALEVGLDEKHQRRQKGGPQCPQVDWHDPVHATDVEMSQRGPVQWPFG
jgi:hypothetical protein